MRFLLESGTYRIDNVGDIAMLRRTVLALLQRHPGARVDVITERPDRLRLVVPEATPIPASPWSRLPVVPVPGRWEGSSLVGRIRWRERLLAGRAPRLARLGKRINARADASERADADRFYQSVQLADAVLAAGGGYINDHFHGHAWKVLATLNLAQGMGKPTAMFGIGLGPCSRPDLIWFGSRILPRLDLLGLREAGLGPAEARRLGVPDDRVVVTGDDAIALASSTPAPPAEHRDRIGVNLRIAAGADVPEQAIPRVRDAVLDAADRRDAGLVPLIIRTADSPENDVDAAARIFGIDGIDLAPSRQIRRPEQTLLDISRCRVVVTGAYHNAVFALAMGVPVVGLCQSDYYVSKLEGVSQGFGAGMTVLKLDDPDLQPRLSSAIDRLWLEAPGLFPVLRASAAEQSSRGEAAYDRFLARLPGPDRGVAS